MTDVSELCVPLGPSSAARADASPRIAPCARGFYRFVDGNDRASVADHVFEPRAPRRRGAALHHRQLAGRLLASGAAVVCDRKRDSQSGASVSLPRRRSDADVITSCDKLQPGRLAY